MREISTDYAFSTPLERVEKEKPFESQPFADFKKVLGQSIEEIDQLLKQADRVTQEMISGKKDVHQAMIAIEQAHVSLRMMIQVRNKIIAAYEEIMRMQV